MRFLISPIPCISLLRIIPEVFSMFLFEYEKKLRIIKLSFVPSILLIFRCDNAQSIAII